jgi:hypothetical protein
MEKIGLAVLLLLLPALFYLTSRVKAGKTSALRSIEALDELPVSVGQSAETGKPLHVSVGIAGVGGTSSSETWAGLTVLSELADEAAACDTPLVVTVADPTVLPMAQSIVQRAYQRHGNPQGYDPTQVRFIAPEPMAYGAGVMGILERESMTGSTMVGAFGDEYLFMGETGARKGLKQIAGTHDPRTLSLMSASADETLVGEEMYAGGAYSTKLPIQIASLLTEDWARWVIVGAIIVMAVFKLLS